MKSFLLSLIVLLGLTLTAQTYIPDSSFGNNGVKIHPVNKEYKRGVILNNNYYLLAYNEICKIDYDGNFVNIFGTNGRLVLEGTYRLKDIQAFGNSVYIYGNDESDPGNIIILKLNENGLDTTFGTNGKAIIDFGAYETMVSMVIEPSGALFCAGSQSVSGTGSMIYFKINPDGGIDTSFDSTGYKSIMLDYSIIGYFAAPYDDGYLLVGQTTAYGTGKNAVLAKVDYNGTLVPGYGTNGLKIVPIPNNASIDLANHNFYNNKLYLETTTYPLPHKLFIYDVAGDIQISNYNLPSSTSYTKVFDDGVYTSGYYSCGPGVPEYNCWCKFNLRRQNFDGTPDATFNNNTPYELNFATGPQRPYCFIKDDNGRLLIVGISHDYFALTKSFSMLRLMEGALETPDNYAKTGKAVYPNPFINKISVNSAAVKSIEVSDVTGRIVGTPKFESLGSQTNIDLSFLSGDGTYFLKVFDNEGGVTITKIIRSSK